MPDKTASDYDISNFKKKYFEQIDFSYWQERLFMAYRRYSQLKTPKNKAKYIVEAYSIYIQVVEILIINMHSLSVEPKNFIKALAMDNNRIQEYAQEARSNEKFLWNFTLNFLYKIRGVSKIDKTAADKISFDINLLKECLKDYSDNYNFLNSYKHGFRVHSTHGENYVAIGTSPENMTRISEGDSQLIYYEFKKEKGGKQTLSETTLSFNNMRVFGKALFAIYYLQNIRLSVLASFDSPKKVTYPTFFINDMESWNKAFGESKFTTALFRFTK